MHESLSLRNLRTWKLFPEIHTLCISIENGGGRKGRSGWCMKHILRPKDLAIVLSSHQAGCIGLPILLELHNSGYQVTVLTRDATRLQGLPANVRIQHVDYDSDGSLIQALQSQDSLVSTVAMSAISHRLRMIDAAIAWCPHLHPCRVHRQLP